MFEHYVILEAYSIKVKRSNKVIIKAFAKDEEDKLMEYNKISQEIVAKLQALVGAQNVLT